MSNTNDTHLNVGANQVEKVENYTHLGQNVSFQNGMDKEIQIRKEKSWKSFWALGKIFIRET